MRLLKANSQSRIIAVEKELMTDFKTGSGACERNQITLDSYQWWSLKRLLYNSGEPG